MSKAVRTTLSLVVSLVLFSALTLAQTGGNNADKDKNNKGHHSRLTKVAFWRHHKDTDKNAKPAQATQAPSKPAQAKTAQIKPVSTKQAAGKLLGRHPDSVKNRPQIPPAVEQRQKPLAPAGSITSENTHNDAHIVAANKSRSRRPREDYIAKDTFVQYGRDGKPIP
jgi:hypothetical protein